MLSQASNGGIVFPLFLFLLSSKINKHTLRNNYTVFNLCFLQFFVQLIFLIHTSLKFSNLFGVFLLNVFDNMMNLIAAATLNLLFLCINCIVFLFAHLVNHANPALIIFIYLIFELLHNFGMILLLFLHFYEKSGLLLCVILFQFMQLEDAIVELHF